MIHLRIDHFDDRYFAPTPNWLFWRVLGLAMAAVSAAVVVGAILAAVWVVVG